MRRSNKKIGFRNGNSMIEIGVVMIIAAVGISAALLAYKKLFIPMQGDAAFSQISSVVDATERSKNTSGGTYPVASSAKIPTVTNLLIELGGIDQSRDVADWTYSCTAGSGQTITIVTSPYSSEVIAQLAATKVVSNKAPWTATVAGTTVTVTMANAVCN